MAPSRHAPLTAVHAAAVAVAVAAALALSACGSTGSSTSGASGGSSTTTVTRTVTQGTGGPSAANEASQGNTATAPLRAGAASAGRPCRSSLLEVRAGHTGAGLGHLGMVLLFKNEGRAVCALGGYPGVALVTGSGGELQAKRSPSGYLGGLSGSSHKIPVLEVGPGQTVSALLEGLDSRQPGGTPCPAYRALLVTPPNFTLTTRITRSLQICRPTVHPVVAGSQGRER
jgi:hypothetical protein